MRVLLLITCLLASLSAHAAAAEPTAEVQAVLQQLFEGMRAGDAQSVQQTFHPEARFLSVGKKDGAPFLFHGDPAAFVQAVGKPHDQIWDERVWDVQIRIDDGLATAWMQYAFFLGDKLSHCGVNAFQFFKTASGWQIIQITDTRRQSACEVPVTAR